MASALVKIKVFAPTISAQVQKHIYTDCAPTPLSEQIPSAWPALSTKSLLEARTPHPFDSHPALGLRLENLHVHLDAVLAKPMAREAEHIIQEPDGLEARIVAAQRVKAAASSLSPRFTFVRDA